MEPSTSSPLPCAVSSSSSSSSSSSHAKLFVGGIPWEATEDSLKEHFIKYGRVVSANLVKEKDTGRSKGYGFVEFDDPANAERALADPEGHVILRRKVDVNKARHSHQNQTDQCQDQDQNGSHISTLCNPKKIFVGGLPLNLTRDEFSNYFSHFGEISEVALIHDKQGRPRGFGFIKFNSEEAVERVLQNRFYELKNKKVEVKMAILKRANNHDHNEDINTDIEGGYGFGNYQDSYWPTCYQVSHFSPSFAGHTSFVGLTGYYSLMPVYYWSPSDSQGFVPTMQNLMPFGNTSSGLYLGQGGYMIGYNAAIGDAQSPARPEPEDGGDAAF